MRRAIKWLGILFFLNHLPGENAFAQNSFDSDQNAEVFATNLRTTGLYAGTDGAIKISSEKDDLKDILVSAFESHPRLKALRVQNRATRENVIEARASYLPQISFETSASLSDRNAELQNGSGFDQNTSPTSASLRLSQTLYNGGRRSLATRNAWISVQSANAQYHASATMIAQEVITDYMSLMSAEAETNILEQSVAILEKLEKSVLARREAGDATLTEVAQTNSRLAAAHARRETARSGLFNARARLISKTGILVQNPQLPHEAFGRIDLTLQEILERSRQTSPVIQNSKLNEQSAQITFQQESRKWLPTVSLSANLTATSDSSPTIARDDDMNVGIQVTMPLYSGGAGKAQTRRAAALVQSAKYESDDALRETRLQLIQLWTQLQSGMLALAAQKASVKASEEALTGISKAQLAGLSTTQDVLDATQDKLNAEIELSRAEFSQYTTRMLIRLYSGELDLLSSTYQ